MQTTLASVIDQHPMLRVGIADEGSNPAYVELPTINFQDVIEWKIANSADYTSYLQRSLEAQHNRLWEHLDRRAPWKLIVHQPDAISEQSQRVRQLDISFAFHHAIADGQSAMIFHRDFLRALNEAIRSGSDTHGDIVYLKSAADLPPPLEDTVPFILFWMYFCIVILAIIWTKIAPTWLRFESNLPWTGKPVALEPYKTNLRIIHVSDKAVSTLITACRANSTTLTPLLHALILASVSSRLPASAASFCASTPISLRRVATAGFDRENTMHCMATGHDHLFSPEVISELRSTMSDRTRNEDFIWKSASELGTNLKSKVSSLPRNDPIALVRWVSDWNEFWLEKVGKPRSGSWECSNAGSLSAAGSEGETGECEIERLIFSQGALPAGAAFSVNVAGVEGKGLSITISWQDTIVDTSLVDGVALDLESWFIRFGERGRFDIPARLAPPRTCFYKGRRNQESRLL